MLPASRLVRLSHMGRKLGLQMEATARGGQQELQLHSVRLSSEVMNDPVLLGRIGCSCCLVHLQRHWFSLTSPTQH